MDVVPTDGAPKSKLLLPWIRRLSSHTTSNRPEPAGTARVCVSARTLVTVAEPEILNPLANRSEVIGLDTVPEPIREAIIYSVQVLFTAFWRA
jgi:hypothetical protein